MLLPYSSMKYLFCTIMIFTFFIEWNQGEQTMNTYDTHSSVMANIIRKKDPMVSTCKPNGDRFCYLTEAAELIIFGARNNRSDLNSTLENVPNETLTWFLTLGLQQLALFLTNNPMYKPADFDSIIQDLLRLINVLNTTGSSAITWTDLKPYAYRLANRKLVLGIVGYALRNAPANTRTYFNDVYLNGVEDVNCKRAISLWYDTFSKITTETWAFRMFDASGKPPTNLLAANTNWLGNWNACHKVKYASKNSSFEFKGRYCRAKIRADKKLLALAGNQLEGFPGNPEELAAIDLGVCVPDFCEGKDVASFLTNTLRLLTVHQFSSIDGNKEVVCENTAEPNTIYYVSLGLIATLTIIVILATLYDCFFRAVLNHPYTIISTLPTQNINTICSFSQSSKLPQAKSHEKLNVTEYQFSNRLKLYGVHYGSKADKDNLAKRREKWYGQFVYKLHRIVLELSAYTTILKPMSKSGPIKCLNGLRVLSMIWIIWGHTYNYIGDQSYFVLLQNAIDLLDLQKQRVDAQIIINALFGVDTFFLISAMLLTLSLMRIFKTRGMLKFYEWPLMYLDRYLRLAPPYIMVFLLYVYVVPYIGRGPLWTTENFPMKNSDCHKYWWAYFLMVSNFVPDGKGTRCLGYLWYVPNDFQLFVIAPILIVPLYYFPIIGAFMLLGVLIASSCILAFNIANTYRVGQILLTLQLIWEDTYIKPYCRAGPYIIGIALGYILFRTDKKKVRLHPIYHLIGWALTIFFTMVSIFGNWRNHDENGTPMSRSLYVAYFVLSRIAWPLAISWIIFTSYKGLAPLIDSILSWRGFTFFTYTSYTTYLIHPMIMVYYMFAQQNLFHATDITLIYLFFGHLIFSLLLGFAAHLVFERTFGVFFSLILPTQKKKSNRPTK